MKKDPGSGFHYTTVYRVEAWVAAPGDRTVGMGKGGQGEGVGRGYRPCPFSEPLEDSAIWGLRGRAQLNLLNLCNCQHLTNSEARRHSHRDNTIV